MRTVVVESPFAGDFDKNILYARFCLRDCLIKRDEAPFASHLLYTQPYVLDDRNADERKFGIDSGLHWSKTADLTAVYIDLGVSKGMHYGIDYANSINRPIEYRTLPTDLFEQFNQEYKKFKSKIRWD